MCTAEDRDEVFGNPHFCTHDHGHTGQHECLCGHHWP